MYMSKKSSWSKYQFKKMFLLDEQRLRRVAEIIRKRLPGPQFYITYEVLRSDNHKFLTTEIDEICQEENLKHSIIMEINVVTEKDYDMRQDGPKVHFSAKVNFVSQKKWPSSNGVSYSVDGTDRDLVLLLDNDLKRYIASDIARVCNIGRFFDAFLMICMSGGFLTSIALSKGAVGTGDRVLFMFLILYWPMTRGVQLLMPGNRFLIGQGVERYEFRKKLSEIILIGIFLGLVIGVAGNFITDWLKTP